MANWWDSDPEVNAQAASGQSDPSDLSGAASITEPLKEVKGPGKSPLENALVAEGVSGPLADLARSIYQQESSSGKNTRTSNAGAVGGMQVTDATFKRFADKGWSNDNPEENARAGVRYLKYMAAKYGDDPSLLAAGYYGGEGAIPKYKAGIAVQDPRNPNAPDTLQYAHQVASRLSSDKWWDADPTVSDLKTRSEVASFVQGLRDPIDGGAQLLTHMLPHSVVEAGDRINNQLARYGVVAPIPTGGLDQMIQDRQEDLAQQREAAGRDGVDAFRVAGNFASPANWGLANLLRAPFLLGAASGALAPVEGDNYWADKAAQVGVGAAVGSGVNALTRMTANALAPKIATEVQALKDAGVSMTPGQILGGGVRTAEERLKSVPFVGGIIRDAERRNIASFDRAAINDSLSSIGESLPSDKSVGHDAIDWAANKIGDRYDAVLSKMTGRLDAPLQKGLATLRRMSAGLPKEEGTMFRRILQRQVFDKFTSQGNADGQAVKEIDEILGKLGRRYARSDDPGMRNMANGVREAQKQFREMLLRQNPGQAQALRAVDRAYAKFLRVQTASARLGTEDGVFSPAQLKSAVRELDATKRKSAYAKGRALGQPLAEAGQKVLGSKIPDSGTPERLLSYEALLSPVTAIPGLAASIPAMALYSPMGQRAVQAALMASRPQTVNALADLARLGTPYVEGAIPMSLLGNVGNR